MKSCQPRASIVVPQDFATGAYGREIILLQNGPIPGGTHALREDQKQFELGRARADGSSRVRIVTLRLVLFEYLVAHRIGMMLPRG
jgi:hypothetical protein